jgi:hypothetical protein
MEYRAKGYEGGTGGVAAKAAKQKRATPAKRKSAWNAKGHSMNGLVVLSTKGFARFEECMKNPGKPTQGNLRGAELLRKLYSKSR